MIAVAPGINEDGLIAPGVPTVEDFRKRAPEVADSIREIAESIQARLDAGEDGEPSATRQVRIQLPRCFSGGSGPM